MPRDLFAPEQQEPRDLLAEQGVTPDPTPAPEAPTPGGDIDYGSAFLRGLARSGEGLASTGSFLTGQGAIPHQEWADEGKELDKPWNIFQDPLSLTGKKALYGIGEAAPLIAGLGIAAPEAAAEGVATDAVPFLQRMATEYGLPGFVAKAAPYMAPAAGVSAAQGLGQNVAQDGVGPGIARTGLESAFSAAGMLPFGVSMGTPLRQFGALMAGQIGASEAQQLAEPAIMGDPIPSASDLMNALPQHAVNSLLPAMLGAIFHEPAVRAKAGEGKPPPPEGTPEAEAAKAEKEAADNKEMLEKLGYPTGEAPTGSRAAPIDLNAQPEQRDLFTDRAAPLPTDGQKDAGNYAMAHARFNGMGLTIETPEGGIRSGTGEDGERFSARMPYDYGYLKGTKGADGDHIDVGVGPDHTSDTAYVINQMHPATGEFDEHKVMLGFENGQQAVDAYTKGFDDNSGAERIMSVTPMPVEDVKALARQSREKPLDKPIEAPETDDSGIEFDGNTLTEPVGAKDVVKFDRLLDAVDRERDRINPGMEIEPAKRIRTMTDDMKIAQVFGYFDPETNSARYSLEEHKTDRGKITPRTETEMLGDARHEISHPLWDKFTPDEKTALRDEADGNNWYARYDIRDRYPNLDVEGQLKEAVADAFGHGRLNRFKDFSPRVQAIFQKIDDFLNRIAAAARRTFGQKATAKDILHAMDRGDIAKREAEQMPDRMRLMSQGFHFTGDHIRNLRRDERVRRFTSPFAGNAIRPEDFKTAAEFAHAKENMKRFKLEPYGPDDQSPNNFMLNFMIKRGDGKNVGVINGALHNKGKTFYVHWMASKNGHHFEPGQLRDIGRQLRAALPAKVREVTGFRVSGARATHGGGPASASVSPKLFSIGRQIDKWPEKVESRAEQVEKDPKFKAFFKKSAAVDAAGKPKITFHFTPKWTERTEAFDNRNANPEGDMGAAIYWTNDPSDGWNNYGAHGVDVQGKISREAERLENEGNSPQQARQIAHAKFIEHYGFAIPAFLSIQKPVIIGESMDNPKQKPTMLHVEFPETDEETGEPKDPDAEVTGTAVDVIDGIRQAARNGKYYIDEANFERLLDDAFERSMDGISAGDLISFLKGVDEKVGVRGVYGRPDMNTALAEAHDENGNYIGHEIIRQGLENAGYDGIIDNTVSRKFGGMNLAPNATHYMVFQPTQVKGLWNPGLWGVRDNRIMFSKGRALIGSDEAPFYSQLEKEIGDAKQKKASGDQWLSYLRNRPGIKAEELESTGIKDFLEASKDEPVTKEELQNMMGQGALRMFEVLRGQPFPEPQKETKEEPKAAEPESEHEGPSTYELRRWIEHVADERLEDEISDMSTREIENNVRDMLDEEQDAKAEEIEEQLMNGDQDAGNPYYDYRVAEIELPEIVEDEGHKQRDLLTGEETVVGRKVAREGRTIYVPTYEKEIADKDWDTITSLKHIDPEDISDEEMQEIHDAIESGTLEYYDSEREAERNMDNLSSRQEAEDEWRSELVNQALREWRRERFNELKDSYLDDYREQNRDRIQDQVRDEYDNGDLEYDQNWAGGPNFSEARRRDTVNTGILPTKWDTSQLAGPKANYRELVFTLPGLTRKFSPGKELFVPPPGVEQAQMANDLHHARLRLIERGLTHLTNGQVLAEMNKGINDPDRLYQLKKGPGRIDKSREVFRYETHFPENDMVMHGRMSDRTTTEGDHILMGDEVQSDIAQQGRDLGYKSTSPEYKAKMTDRLEKANKVVKDAIEAEDAAVKDKDDFFKSYSDFKKGFENDDPVETGYQVYMEGQSDPQSGEFKNRADADAKKTYFENKFNDRYEVRTIETRPSRVAFDRQLELKEQRRRQLEERTEKAKAKAREIESAITRPSIPDAPFKETYYEAMLSRMLQLAAKHGYDGFGWTTGKRQSQRWSQATHFDRIDVKKTPDGYEVDAWQKGQGHNPAPNVNHFFANEQELKSAIGKELASRALKQMEGDKDNPKTDHAKLIGDDLITPSEGFTTNYDEKYVNYVNSRVKKYGLKVGKAEVPIEDRDNHWSVIDEQGRLVLRLPTEEAAKFWASENNNDPRSNVRKVTVKYDPSKNETIHYVRFKDAAQQNELREGLGKQQKLMSMGNPIGGPVPPPSGAVKQSFMKRIMDAMPERTRKLMADVGRDAQMLATPMAVKAKDKWMDPHVEKWRARIKDWANGKAYNQFYAQRENARITKEFNEASRKLVYEAMDEEGRERKSGLAQAPQGKGLTRLNPKERALAEKLDNESALLIAQLIQAGKLDKNFQRIPYWVPRILHELSQGGPYKLPGGEPEMAGDWNGEGRNFKTSSKHLMHRKYSTIEETEAAAQQKMLQNVRVIRDIRTHVIAMANVRDALVGTHVINELKALQKSIGRILVVDGEHPGFKTIDHPSFKTWKPRLEKDDQGNWYGVKDQETGKPVLDKVAMTIHPDFEGPLRAVLSQQGNAVYNAMMALKGKTMGLIMYSPVIHNAVEWGRALPAFPFRVFTGLIYRDGWRFQKDEAGMREAIMDGGVRPIGHQGGMQDIDSVLQQRSIEPGGSWTAQILGKVGDIFSEKAGENVRRGIDAAGNFWHNTLLWDRVRDLQFGLYQNFRDHLLAKGMDRKSAVRMAGEFANVYAGSMPMESMSHQARQVANLMLFSRSFTLGNIAAMKAVFTGLSRGVQAQIGRDSGEAVLKAANSMARRKALGILAADIGLYYIANSLVQSSINVLSGRNDLSQEMQEYVDRLVALMKDDAANPLHLLNPSYQLNHLMSTYYNEPGKQDRIMVGHDKDGTAIYARNPAGKIGEEFVGWISNPIAQITKKLGTLVKPTLELINNDKGFGRKLYNPYEDTPEGWVKNMGKIAWNYVSQQFPVDSAEGAWNAATQPNARAIEAYKALGPLGGITFSQGAPGGPAAGQMFRANEEYRMRLNDAMPGIRDMIRNGQTGEAVQQLVKLGVPPRLIQYYIRTTLNPSLRLNPKAMEQFYREATPEEIQAMNRLLQ